MRFTLLIFAAFISRFVIFSQDLRPTLVKFGVVGNGTILNHHCLLTEETVRCSEIPTGMVVDDRTYFWPHWTCANPLDPEKEKKWPVYQVYENRPDMNGDALIDYKARCLAPINRENITPVDKFMKMTCSYFRDPACYECPYGYRWNFTSAPDRPGIKSDQCRLLDYDTLKENEDFALQMQDVVFGRLKRCPEGTYREDTFNSTDDSCSGKCPQNCRLCVSNQTCEQCHLGYKPTYRSKGCVIEDLCSKGYYFEVDRCIACSAKTYGCQFCHNITGRCTNCIKGLTLLTTINEQRCISTCKMGYYMAETGKCEPCAPYCRSCNHPYKCFRCIDGLFEHRVAKKVSKDDQGVVRCYNLCPEGTYPSPAFPFRCLTCHPACEACTGPDQRDCLRCKVLGEINELSRLPRCLGLTPKFKFLRQYKNFTQEEKNKLGLQITGMSKPMLLKNEEQSIFSPFFTDLNEADRYFRARKAPPTFRWYPQCTDNDCLNNCAKPSLMQACPYCRKNFAKTLDRRCVLECPQGMTKAAVYDPDRKVTYHRCFVCPHYPKCLKCQLNLSFFPRNSGFYNFTYDQYRTDLGKMRFVCETWAVGEQNCTHPNFFFSSSLGCIPCHRECKEGCVGRGSDQCKACKNVLDITGHCVKSCQRGYVVAPNTTHCTVSKLKPVTDRELTERKRTYTYNSLLYTQLIMFSICIFFGWTFAMFWMACNQRNSLRFKRRYDRHVEAAMKELGRMKFRPRINATKSAE